VDRLDQFMRPHRLDEIAMGSGRKGLEQHVAILIDRQHHEFGVGHLRGQGPDTIDTTRHTEIDVDDDDTRSLGGQNGDRFRRALAGRDAGAGGGGIDHGLERGAGAGVIFDNADRYRLIT
jgi:hypothetical protein